MVARGKRAGLLRSLSNVYQWVSLSRSVGWRFRERRRRCVRVVLCAFIWRGHSFCGRVDTAHSEDVVTPGRGRQRKKVESKRRVGKG